MTADFERDLRDVMVAQTSGAVAPADLAQSVRARFRRRRRNRRIAAAVAALAVAVAVPSGVRLASRPDAGRQQITAARPAPGAGPRGPSSPTSSPTPAPTSVPTPTDEAIRAAFLLAFTGNTPPAQALAAIEDGPSVAAARASLLAAHPALGSTLKVSVDSVVLTDGSHATVSFTLTYNDPSLPASEPGPGSDGGSMLSTSGKAIRTAAGWQVTRASYCSVVGLAGTQC